MSAEAEALLLVLVAGGAVLGGVAGSWLARRRGRGGNPAAARERLREANRPRAEMFAILSPRGGPKPEALAHLPLPPGPTLYERAIAARDAGDLSTAAALLRESLATLDGTVTGPGEGREGVFLAEAYARFDLFDCLERAGHEEEAWEELRFCADRFGDGGVLVIGREMRAKLADRRGRHEEQIEHLSGALAATPPEFTQDRAGLLLLRAQANLILSRHGAAYADAAESAALRAHSPLEVDSHRTAGLAAALCGDGEAAVRHTREALLSAEASGTPAAIADAHCTLSAVHTRAGRLAEAWDACRSAREAFPEGDWVICEREFEVLSLRGRDAEALERLEHADAGCAIPVPYLARRERAGTDFNRATVLGSLVRHEEALSAARRARPGLQSRPNHLRTLDGLVLALEADRCRQDEPRPSAAPELHARLAAQCADLRGALEAEAERPGRLPGDGVAASDTAWFLLQAAFHLGDAAAMGEMLDIRDAENHIPVNVPSTLYWRGHWHLLNGDARAAAEAWRAAVESGPDTGAAARARTELAALPTGDGDS